MNSNKHMAALGRMIASMAIFGTVGIFIKSIPFPSAVIALGRGIIGSIFLLLTAAVSKKALDVPAIKKNLKLLILLNHPADSPPSVAHRTQSIRLWVGHSLDSDLHSLPAPEQTQPRTISAEQPYSSRMMPLPLLQCRVAEHLPSFSV